MKRKDQTMSDTKKATKYEQTNPVSTPRTVAAGEGRGTHQSIADARKSARKKEAK
jgi:hypothetical protein